MANKKVVDKFKVILKSRNKGKIGNGDIEMLLTYHIPYKYIADLIGFLETIKNKK